MNPALADFLKDNSFVAVLAIALFGYTSINTNDRYTRTDALTDQRLIWEKIGALDKRVGMMPPRELTERIAKLEFQMVELHKDIDELLRLAKAGPRS